jgi:hypothetical protein
MPSPFPGMDPYLEAPAFFPDLHDRFITRVSETLQACLPDPYYAVIGSRVWVETSRRSIGPDVEVLRPSVAFETDDALVTAIEMLSLTNKTPGAHGRDLYLRKQAEIVDGRCHLVEIDLLRGGRHSTAVPWELLLEGAGRFDYHVCIYRFDQPEEYAVYPIQLNETLPGIAIPLLPGDGSVDLDLQVLFDHVYDAGPYRKRSPYRPEGPIPPLPPEMSEWAESRIRDAGRPPIA